MWGMAYLHEVWPDGMDKSGAVLEMKYQEL